MNFLSRLQWIFRRFVDKEERDVYDFLMRATHAQSQNLESKSLRQLQKNTAKLMLLLEWKFKGYKRLTPYYRSNCYQHLEVLEQDFSAFLSQSRPSDLTEALGRVSVFLHQKIKVKYLAGSSFDRLLQPQGDMTGDCNQLVALYVHLLGRHFDISELQIKLLPQHVCLHYQGTDYEATNGQTKRYRKFTRIASLSELISVNLLDVADQHTQHQVPLETQLGCQRLAAKFTGEKKLITHNIQALHGQLVQHALKKNHFSHAEKWAKISGEKKLLHNVLFARGTYALKQKNFAKARHYFQQARSPRGQQTVDLAELNSLIASVKGCQTLNQYRDKRSELGQILQLGRQLKKPKVTRFAQEVLKQI